ncbi:protein spinster isoform X1 [Bacillus rossius redtenbacheri]|uniref:protein spinster isoform X1 n=1 Tax=Bacillus rossius redtenbacheri TaxID=93214 RepID=UPI002FDEFC61
MPNDRLSNATDSSRRRGETPSRRNASVNFLCFSTPVSSSWRNGITVGILCFVNLINYMDRFTIAGILSDVLKHFDIQNAKGGLLQTAFVLSYMVFAPLFGYLGDRYSRRAIMAFGVFLWSLTTLVGSFMDNYNWFLVFRTLVGIGEASYSTIAPTIISDMFVGDMRSKMLALFYFAIPVGSGLGYIVGSETAKATGHWQWGLRVTPFVGFVAVLLILLVMDDPARGESEGSAHLAPTSWREDIAQLCRNRTFMLSTAGFTCVAFVTGALAWWGPIFIYEGLRLQPGTEDVHLSDVSYKFGIITMVSGIIGVPLGSFLAQRLRPRFHSVDPMICAVGLISSMPLLFCAMLFADKFGMLCYFLVFFGELLLNLNWSIVADILLYVVLPTRRATAEAFQILFSHALGDAGSPYLIGVISEAILSYLSGGGAGGEAGAALNATLPGNGTDVVGVRDPQDAAHSFHSLQYALYITCFVEVLGGLFFLLSSSYVVADKTRVEKETSATPQLQIHEADDLSGDHHETLMRKHIVDVE